ncbi:DUF302 domain-containing protein [Allochromatium vinosum]|uniref:DUF302 domain-containing protein n=1 Tax=Allochromatium vinosum (strain ATCC 17899 / DSM 180 / NBRC 103801 / NCIMB 10441 / D) TaxID=572477 RepID=D3RWC1_ALLVD|nr:DUF302 domain-containing protein [Allochromatium vinosum]ADC64133.1 protein of unknown function DUF302 [Allochromatium vinosum DSM 180]
MCTGIDWRLLTLVLAFGLAGCNMSATVLKEKPSPYAFDATVTAITEKAQAQGWEVAKVFDFQTALVAHQRPDPGRIKVLKLCSPEYASRMFSRDETKLVAVMAPCSIAVYEKADGRTYVSTMNMALMWRLMGDDIGPILADIAEEDARILDLTSRAP